MSRADEGSNEMAAVGDTDQHRSIDWWDGSFIRHSWRETRRRGIGAIKCRQPIGAGWLHRTRSKETWQWTAGMWRRNVFQRR